MDIGYTISNILRKSYANFAWVIAGSSIGINSSLVLGWHSFYIHNIIIFEMLANKNFYSLSMEHITIKLRKNSPPEVFKSIRVIGYLPDRFLGSLSYVRTFYQGYDYKNGDILDSQILASIKSLYPESFQQLNMLTLFDKQYDDCLKITRCISQKIITTYFYPLLENDSRIPTSLRAYKLKLNLSLWLSPSDPRLEYIYDALIVDIPYKQLPTVINTIKSPTIL